MWCEPVSTVSIPYNPYPNQTFDGLSAAVSPKPSVSRAAEGAEGSLETQLQQRQTPSVAFKGLVRTALDSATKLTEGLTPMPPPSKRGSDPARRLGRSCICMHG